MCSTMSFFADFVETNAFFLCLFANFFFFFILSLKSLQHYNNNYSQVLPINISWNRMASGARITLTSPDPSSSNAHPDTEHEHTIFSETETDTVTFNTQAHDKQTASNDASSISSTDSIEIDESASTQSQPQKVKVTIDSVAPYASDKQIPSTNSVDGIDGIDESENLIEHTNDLHDGKSEKRVKNDEL